MLHRVAAPGTGKTRSHKRKRTPSFGEAFFDRYLAGAEPAKNPYASTTQLLQYRASSGRFALLFVWSVVNGPVMWRDLAGPQINSE